MKEETRQKMFESFARLFLLSHRLEYISDQELKKDDLTVKQFLTIAVIEKMFDEPPSISQVAEALSTTHQNVKQIANQLDRKGFIKIERDERDKRRLLLKVTRKNKEYWESRAEEHERFITSLFSSLNDDEIHMWYSIIMKLLEHTEQAYRNARGSV